MSFSIVSGRCVYMHMCVYLCVGGIIFLRAFLCGSHIPFGQDPLPGRPSYPAGHPFAGITGFNFRYFPEEAEGTPGSFVLSFVIFLLGAHY